LAAAVLGIDNGAVICLSKVSGKWQVEAVTPENRAGLEKAAEAFKASKKIDSGNATPPAPGKVAPFPVGGQSPDTWAGMLISHGEAPHQFNPEHSRSYYVQLSINGHQKPLWGVGLQGVLEGMKEGDFVALSRSFDKEVVVNEERHSRYNWTARPITKEEFDAFSAEADKRFSRGQKSLNPDGSSNFIWQDKDRLIERLRVPVGKAVDKTFDKTTEVDLTSLAAQVSRFAGHGLMKNDELEAFLADAQVQKALGLIVVKDPDRPGKMTCSTEEIAAEETDILQGLQSGMGNWKPAVDPAKYVTPASLQLTDKAVEEELKKGGKNEMTAEMLKRSAAQFALIHKYVATSADQFSNIKGGSGVGKSFLMEKLVGVSIKAGRNVFVLAPYGRTEPNQLRGGGC
jgi:hypothetical protein